MSNTPLNKRKWWYTQPPKTYDMAPCACGYIDTQWSEYEKHLWCDKCQIDFIPEHNGIFDGPIPIGACGLMGIHFNRIIADTLKLEIFNPDTGEYVEAQP